MALSDFKTANTPKEVVFDEGTVSGKVLGMDLADDPYIGESDAELFGNPDGEDAGAPLGETSGDGAEEDFANVKSRVLPSPGNPTQSQDGDHRAQGHIPYRTWCSECVRARCTGEQHRKRGGTRHICVFSFDYLHLDASGIPVARKDVMDGAEVSLTILVAKESKGKAVFAHVVPQKGVDSHHFAVDILMKDIGWLGYTAISLR